MNNKIIIITGYSSSGKDTLSKMLEKECGYNFVISTTTRPIRPNESDRNPYNFITNEEFEKLIQNDEMVEYREYYTLLNNLPSKWYYGVEKKEIQTDKPYVVVLDITGLRGFKKYFSDKIISFFIYVNEETRKNRCILRGDFDETEWDRRLKDDNERFPLEIIQKEVDFVIDGGKSPHEVFVDVNSKINKIISNNER